MRKAETVLSTPPATARAEMLHPLASLAPPAPTRRAALSALGWTGTAALSGAVLGHSLADAAEALTPSPDRDVIRACADFVAACDQIDNRPRDQDLDDDGPLMLAYDRSIEALCDAKATTLDGLIAKARAANHMAQAHPGEGMNGTIGEIAWSIVNDLARLGSGRAV